MFVELGSEGEKIINLDLNSDVVVRDILLGVCQSFSNNFTDLAVV